jgi:hypothetical protein
MIIPRRTYPAPLTISEYLNNLVTRSGLQLHTYSPGDGITRYRFFEIRDGERQDFFGPRNGIATVLGRKSAIAWIEAYLDGQASQEPPE